MHGPDVPGGLNLNLSCDSETRSSHVGRGTRNVFCCLVEWAWDDPRVVIVMWVVVRVTRPVCWLSERGMDLGSIKR